MNRERVFSWGLVIATVALAGQLALWLILTPPFRAPDEPLHLNSAIRMEFGKGWPAPGDARLSDVIETALGEARFGRTLPGRAQEQRDNTFDTAFPPDEFSAVTEAASVEQEGNDYDQMTQHPPAYYATVGAVMAALGLPGSSWWLHLMVARVLTALMVIPVPLLIGLTARRLTGSVAVSLCAAAVPAFIPQFAHINSSVTNDALMTLSASLVCWMAVKVAMDGATWRKTVTLAAFLGLALFTKGFAMALVPMVLAAVLLAPGLTLRGRLVRWVVGGCVAAAAGGFWWVMNLWVHGTVQPAGRPPLWPVNRDPGRGLDDFVYPAMRQIAGSFWGRFGWLELGFAEWIWMVSTVTLVVLVGAGVWQLRGRRLVALALLSVPVAVVGIVMSGSYDRFLEYGFKPGLQGRYLFAAILPLAALAASALQWMFASRWRSALAVAAWSLAGLALSLHGFVVGLRGFYTPWGAPLTDGIDRWTRWAPGGALGVGSAIGALVVSTVAIGVVGYLAYSAARSDASAAVGVESETHS